MSEPGTAKAGATILLVDGEVLVRHALAQYLRECGYRVVEAATSDEALTFLEDRSVPIDAVLADAQCPGTLDGFSLARHIRESGAGVQVLLAGSPARAANEAARLCEEGPELARPYDHQL
ncbi:response regulator, partial [Nostoc sp. NIES-2111]